MRLRSLCCRGEFLAISIRSLDVYRATAWNNNSVSHKKSQCRHLLGSGATFEFARRLDDVQSQKK